MNTKQENKLSMYLTVRTVCDRNITTIATLQAFGDAYTEFGTRVTNIQTLAQTQSVDSTGLAADKDTQRRGMAVAATEVANAVYAWARKAGNNDLATQADVSVSTFMDGRDTLAATNALNIHALATASLANLGPYGVTAAKLTDLKARIDAYSASLSKPRDAVTSGRTATKQLAAEFDAADAVLGDQMDTLIGQFRTANAKFVEDYTNARVIVDNTGGKSGGTTPEPPKPPTP
jgi:hypothetical protein